jgi:Tol biopolymer transport system component
MSSATPGLLLGLVLALVGASAVAQSTTIVSVSSGGVPGNANSEWPVLSADGRYVLFQSQASNLAPGDPDATHDAYLRDVQNGTTEMISVDSNEVHAAGFSLATSLSADGSLAIFFSNAPDVVAGDPGTDFDVFVRDRAAGTTSIVSVDSSGAHGNGDSEQAVISPGGRFVAFRSRASNLVANDTNAEWDVFVHDRQTGATERVNLGPGGAEAHGDSYPTSMSFDGRYVLFSSLAADLVAGDTNNERDIFVRDRQTGQTRRISVSTGGVQTNGDSHAGFLSADGRFATYVSLGNNLVANDTNGVQDVFVHELATAATTRVSVASGGAQSNGFATGNGISADGRYVAMASTATNLVPGDAGLSDVFVHDRLSGLTTRVGLAANGDAPNAASQGGSISADGRYVAFFSGAGNVVPGVGGGTQHVYRRDRGPASPHTALCAGYPGTACPCGNHSTNGANEGCLNSFGLGGKLVGVGNASLAADSLVLAGSQMPNAPCLYFQGSLAVNGGLGVAFGDGIRCAGGTNYRLGTKTNAGGASQYPGPGDVAISVRGSVTTPGSRTYQIWYRNAASFCTASTFNLTNGLWVLWTL